MSVLLFVWSIPLAIVVIGYLLHFHHVQYLPITCALLYLTGLLFVIAGITHTMGVFMLVMTSTVVVTLIGIAMTFMRRSDHEVA